MPPRRQFVKPDTSAKRRRAIACKKRGGNGRAIRSVAKIQRWKRKNGLPGDAPKRRAVVEITANI